MRPQRYERATSLDQAVEALSEPGTVALAGGTELLNWLRIGISSSEHLLDVHRLPELLGLRDLPAGGLRIGSAATLAEIASDTRVTARWPVLAESIHRAASAQLRNRATIGGNLLQKTRCAYFRSEDLVPCNRRRPGSGCAALDGHSERHALFGWTEDCGATLPSDPIVALAALDAEVVTRRAAGARRFAVTDLHLLPHQSLADTVLEPGELIEAIEIAAPAPFSAYLKVRERTSYEYSIISAAATAELNDDGLLSRVTLALGSVALRPWRLLSLEQSLLGRRPGDARIGELIDQHFGSVQAFGSSGYKRTIATAATRRVLDSAIGTIS